MRGYRLLISLTAILSVSACAAISARAAGRVVTVGVYQSASGAPSAAVSATGFFVDLLSQIAGEEGWELRPVQCEWSDCLAGLNDGRIDIMPDVAWSPDRAMKFDFHQTAVIESWSQVYTGSGRHIDTFHDLDNLTVAIMAGSIQENGFRQLVSGLGVRVTVLPCSSLDEVFAAVKSGRADAAVSNHFYGDYFFRSFGLEKSGVVFQPVSVYFATGRGRNADLMAAIEKSIRSQRSNPGSRYYAAMRKWMSGPEMVADVPGYVYWTVAAVLGLFALALGVMFLLRSQVRTKTAHLAHANRELKQTQLRLQKSESLLKATQEIANVGGWEYDVDAQLMTWTDETYRIHDLDPEAFRQHNVDMVALSSERYDPKDRDLIANALACCAADGVPYDIEVPFISCRGRHLNVKTSARAIRDESGRIIRLVGTLMDVTLMKQEQEARARAENELRGARRMETIGHLAGGIAHDFNNLLAAIMGYAGLILRRPDVSAQIRADVGQMQIAGERAANLTQQLLTFGAKRVLHPKVVSINSVVTGLEKLLRRLIGENIEILVNLAGDAGNVFIDSGQLEQVIINLSVNGRDAMKGGGTLRIETAPCVLESDQRLGDVTVEAGRWALLTVADRATTLTCSGRLMMTSSHTGPRSRSAR